jgi:hypothetical protein
MYCFVRQQPVTGGRGWFEREPNGFQEGNRGGIIVRPHPGNFGHVRILLGMSGSPHAQAFPKIMKTAAVKTVKKAR